MKKNYIILLATALIFYSAAWGQHDYDNQSVIYSDNNENVGIGTNSPYTHSKLDIQSDYSTNKFASQLHLHTVNNTYGMFLGSYDTSLGYISVGGHYNTSGNHLARSEYSTGIYQYQGNIRFYSNSNLIPGNTFQPTYRMIIHNNGNVGIGTNNPEAQLHVNGSFNFLSGSERLLWASKHVGGTDHRSFLAPRLADNSGWDWNQEFGYQNYYRAWYFDSNVGIGTNNPEAKLDIRGKMNIETDEDAVITFNNTDNSWQYFEFKRNGIRKTWLGLNAGNDFSIFKEGGGNIILNGGNVGIGITDPQEKLHVNGDMIVSGHINGAKNDGVLAIHADGWSQNGAGIELSGNNQEGSPGGLSLIASNGNGDPDTAPGIRFFDWNGSSWDLNMTIKNNGNVGIGTTETGCHKLAVEGSIGARDVRVQPNGWCDFVFEKGYSLSTLEEVETHIKENGHLKDIPSEAEVKANGINLGEMDAKLLQKIEELTLYLIEQNKQNQVQKQQLQLLQKQNEYLIKRIETLENQ